MKKIIKYLYLVSSFILLIYLLYICFAGRNYLNVKKNKYLGNRPSNINYLKSKEGKLPFSFAFISDTENSDASLWLIKQLISEDIDFLVFAGDFVNSSTFPEHRLFIYNISRCNPKIPVFLVPSNHDVEPKENKGDPIKFTEEDFSDLYGPMNFSFIYQDCLFIFISNINPDIPEYYTEGRNYLEKILSGRDSNIKRTFVFCSNVLRKISNKVLPVGGWTTAIDEIIEKYGVDYVISGDYHRHYELIADNGIKYIVSGSGGSHYHGKDLGGRFRSGTKITVYDDCVTEEILVYNKKLDFPDNGILHYVFNKIMPTVENKFWWVYLVLILLVVNFIFSVYNVSNKGVRFYLN